MRLRDLFGQRRDQHAVDLYGVVSASGVGGANVPPAKEWTITFSLDAWRVGTGDVCNEELRVQRHVAEQEIVAHQNELRPYSVVHLKAELLDTPAGETPAATMLKFVGRIANDEQLNRSATELQKPVTFEDPLFGTFTLDRRVNWFEVATHWNGSEVRLALDAARPEDVKAALEAARALWREQAEWDPRIEECAVEQLLGLKNETWRDDDEDDVSPDEFVQRMTVESVTIDPDGLFTFYYDDGDLFGGHAIVIGGSLETGPDDASIAG